MDWFRIVALISAGLSVLALLYHFILLVRTGRPVDYALRAGNTGRAIIYSITTAMSPSKKESAYLHLPAYGAGIFYHLGTFLSFLIFILLMTGISPTGHLRTAISIFLAVTSLSGIWILFRRFFNRGLRSLSNPDDYLSNLLVTIFQIMTVLALWSEAFIPVYFIEVSILLLYMPFGKLRHVVYFFAARYHLGYFFGYRGTWPPVRLKYRK